MNKNHERCSRCSRRKLLTTGCLRKWSKPMESKQFQRTMDNKKEYNDTNIVSCVIFSDRKSQTNTSKFFKFWKTKLFLSSSVRSLQRFFASSRGNEFMCNLRKQHDPAATLEPKSAVEVPIEQKRESENLKKTATQCNHPEGHIILRGHEKHSSPESCAIFCQLYKHGWYWGNITSSEAEELLAGQHDNVFLVRDSYSTQHLLCVSFRCVGRTLHTRLRHANGLFSLDSETFVPANRLSEHCATVDVALDLFEGPVRLARPLNRFAKLDSLQMICRFVIRQTVPANAFYKLPLPPSLISYVSKGSDYIAYKIAKT